MSMKSKVMKMLASTSLVAMMFVSPAMAFKYKLERVMVTSFSISGSALAKQLKRRLPKNVSSSELRAMERDIERISRTASSKLRSKSANGKRNAEIELCGRRVCISLRFKRRKNG